jgi:hypothetical protein
MLGVVLTIWLLVQLPVGLAVARFIAGPRRKARRNPESRPRTATLPRAA